MSSVSRNAGRCRVTIALERLFADVADRVVEEARPNGAVGFDRPPTSTARCSDRRKRRRAGERGVVARQPPQLVAATRRRTPNRTRPRSVRSSLRPGARTRRSRRQLRASPSAATALQPAERPRRHVGGEKRDAVERHGPGVIDEPRQLAEIQAMQGRARRDRHLRREPAQPGDAALDDRERGDAAHGVIRRLASHASSETTTRENDRATSSAHRSSSTPLVSRWSVITVLAEQPRRVEHFGAQQRLAAGEHHQPRAQSRQRRRRAARSPRACRSPAPLLRHQSHDTQRLLQRLVGIEDDQRQDERPVRRFASRIAHAVRSAVAVDMALPRLLGRHRSRLRLSTGSSAGGASAGVWPRQPIDAAPDPAAARRCDTPDGQLAHRRWNCRSRGRSGQRPQQAPRPLRAELGVHERVQRAVELRRVGRAVHHREIVRSRPSSASRRAAP